MLALPIFPGSRPPSIVGAYELNFCVRDENRWTSTLESPTMVKCFKHTHNYIFSRTYNLLYFT